jgi:hypothetical protein
VCTDFQFGSCDGRSRHGAPVLETHSIAFTMTRFGRGLGAARPRSGGSRSLIRCHCSSVSSWRCGAIEELRSCLGSRGKTGCAFAQFSDLELRT